MNTYSGFFGAIRGLISLFKNRGGIVKSIEETERFFSILLQPIRNKYNGKIPNIIYTDSFLIGFVFKSSVLYLMFYGTKDPFLLGKATLQVSSNALDMSPSTFDNLLKSICVDNDELALFESGAVLAEETYELFLNQDRYSLLKICDHMFSYYKILPY